MSDDDKGWFPTTYQYIIPLAFCLDISGSDDKKTDVQQHDEGEFTTQMIWFLCNLCAYNRKI